MTQDYVPRKREWREIAAEAAKEPDPKRRMQLAARIRESAGRRDFALRQKKRSSSGTDPKARLTYSQGERDNRRAGRRGN
jgi:hypothetical protein